MRMRSVGFCTLLLMGLVATSLATGAVAAGASRGHVVEHTLVRGAPIHGANGITFDAEGDLYVASFAEGTVVAMDAKSGRILDRIGAGTDTGTPDDLAFGPDGALYWTSVATGEVFKQSPDGTISSSFVAPGMNPITFTGDGRLLVGQAFFGDGLYELDTDTLAITETIIPDSGTPPFLSQFNGFDVGPDGLLYAVQPFFGRIVSIDIDAVDPAGSIEVIADALAFPAAVKVDDATGDLYAVVQASGQVIRVEETTGQVHVVTTLPEGLDNLAMAPDGRWFVSHANNGAVYTILPSGQTRTVSPAGLIAPGGVAVMPDGHAGETLYVADLWTLGRFDGRTGRGEGITTQSFVPGGMPAPFTVAADGENLVLSSWLSGRVTVWNPTDGVAVDDYAIPPDAPPVLNAIRFGDEIVVAQPGGVRVLGAASPMLVLPVPSGLAVDGDHLYTTDWATGSLWQVAPDIRPIIMPGPNSLARPEGLAMDHDGMLLVVETGAGRLTRVNPTTGDTATVADGLELGLLDPTGGQLPPTWIFNGVAAGEHGDIYVTGDVHNVIYRITEHP